MITRNLSRRLRRCRLATAIGTRSNFWAPARLLSSDGRWFSCTIRHVGGPLWITHAAERVRSEMSGSPIVSESGTAIGVVCTVTAPREGGPNARLSDNLPGWLLREASQKG